MRALLQSAVERFYDVLTASFQLLYCRLVDREMKRRLLQPG